MADLDIPCPQCTEKLVLDERTSGQRVVCPSCDALITMPALPDPRKQPSLKSALPSARLEGEQPRAHAIETGHAFPAVAPQVPDVSHAPAADRLRAVLPALRRSDRPLPDLTPAPYQAGQSAAPVIDAAPSLRAELPAPRPAHEGPRLRAPLVPDEPAESLEPVVSAPPPAAPPEPENQDQRPTNHPFGGARKLHFRPQGAVTVDPEIKDGWGIAGGDAEGGHTRNRRIILWATAIALPLLIGVLWQTLNRRRPITPEAALPRSASDHAAADDVRQASEAARKFLATTTLDERVQWVRHPDVTKSRMQAWYTPANPIKPLKVLRFHDRSTEQTIDGSAFLLLYMELDDFSTRAIGAERTEDGYKMDWESFVFWAAVPWGEFLSRQPTEPADFRVTVEIDDYYSFGYKDETKFFCYKLTDPENWANCWGYCGIDSQTGMEINRMIRRQRQVGMNVIKAILRLRFEPDTRGHNQVLIDSVVQDGWLTNKP